MRTFSLVFISVLAVACGPQKRDPNHTGDDDDGSGSVDAPDVGPCVPSTEGATPDTCTDGRDNDCDNAVDCGDPDCSGIGGCPVCGQVENPEAQPLALPDGVSSGASCNTDADCMSASPSTPNCIIAGTAGAAIKECHASYSSVLDFVGFPANATLTDTNKLLKVCMKIEHSWMRDLHMELISPPDMGGNRRKMALHKFIDRTGDEAYLGEANDNDTAANPVPGVGYEYCWDHTATVEMINGDTATWMGFINQVPMGNYKPATPFTALQDAPLNGTWELRVTDLWGIDNGFMFEWSITFDPSLVVDCSGPIIQ